MSVHEYHVFQQNDQNLALANMTMSDCVSLSPKGGGAEPAWPPSKSTTEKYTYLLTYSLPTVSVQCRVVFTRRAILSSCLPNDVRTTCCRVTRTGSCRAVTRPTFLTSPGTSWKNSMSITTIHQMHGMLCLHLHFKWRLWIFTLYSGLYAVVCVDETITLFARCMIQKIDSLHFTGGL